MGICIQGFLWTYVFRVLCGYLALELLDQILSVWFNFSRNYQNILKVAEPFCICSINECQNVCMYHIWAFQLSTPYQYCYYFNFSLPDECVVACNCGFLASGSGVLSQDRKEKYSERPMLGRLWCGKIYLGENWRHSLGFQSPISISSPMEEVQPCLHQGPK